MNSSKKSLAELGCSDVSCVCASNCLARVSPTTALLRFRPWRLGTASWWFYEASNTIPNLLVQMQNLVGLNMFKCNKFRKPVGSANICLQGFSVIELVAAGWLKKISLAGRCEELPVPDGISKPPIPQKMDLSLDACNLKSILDHLKLIKLNGICIFSPPN